MIKELRPMKEVHEIQEKLYEDRKEMTAKEKLAAIHRGAEEAKKKYGLKLRRHHPVGS